MADVTGEIKRQDISMHRGDWKYFVLNFGEDITGWTVYFTVVDPMLDNSGDLTDTNALVTIDVTTHLDQVNGNTAIPILSALTKSLTPGTYEYEIRVKTLAGYPRMVMEGIYLLESDRSRRAT